MKGANVNVIMSGYIIWRGNISDVNLGICFAHISTKITLLNVFIKSLTYSIKSVVSHFFREIYGSISSELIRSSIFCIACFEVYMCYILKYDRCMNQLFLSDRCICIGMDPVLHTHIDRGA